MKRTKVMIHTIAFVAIVMIGILLAVITISAETYTGIAGFDITWTLDTETGVMEFSGEGSMDSFKYGWNKYASSVKTVIISDGITSIGDNAFRSCENLTEVRLPHDLKVIGEGAFWGCMNLTHLQLPRDLEEIGGDAFYRCKSLTHLQFPEKLTSIGGQAFTDSGLEEIVLPDSVVSLGVAAFSSCKQLRSVELPDTLTEISHSCFSNCESLVYIKLPKQLNIIRRHGLGNCSSMTELVLPEGVETLEDAALVQTPIQRLVIPGSVTYMGENALNYVEEIEILDLAAFCRAYSFSTTFRFTQGFYYKGALITTLTVPASVKDFQAMGFSCYPRLRWIEVERGNPVYTASGNCLIHIENKEVVLGCANSSIPGNGSVTKIGRSAFAYNLELLTFSIPDGVKIIGEDAFRACWNLIYLYLPDTVTDIQISAFRGCNNLTGIRVPKNLTNCASDAFALCESLYVVWNRSKLDVSIGKASVGQVGLNARVLLDGNNRVIENKEASYSNGFLYDRNGLLAYVGSQTTVTLPVDTASRGYGAKLRGFIHVIIPSGATEIPDGMFEGCTSLRSVQISETVKTIGHGAFAYCPNLKTITVDSDNSTYYVSGNCLIEKVKRDVNLSGDKWESMEFGRILFGDRHSAIPTDPFVREIADLAFCDESMDRIFIPDNIWILGYECFGKDDRLMLKEIHLNSVATWARMISNKDYNSGIHSHLQVSLFMNAQVMLYVQGEPVIGDLVIPGEVKTVQANFRRYGHISSLTFEEGVERIVEYAFEDCGFLESVTFPVSMKSIENDSFFNTYVDSVHIKDIAAWCGVNVEESFVTKSGYVDLFVNGQPVTDLVIPYGTTSISSRALSSFGTIQSITIPETVKKMGAVHSKVSKIYISDLAAWFNVTFSFVAPTDSCDLYVNQRLVKHLKIPHSVEKIPFGCLYAFSNLESITIPETVTLVEQNPWYRYSARLQQVVYENTYGWHVTWKTEAYDVTDPAKNRSLNQPISCEPAMFTITFMVDGAVYEKVQYWTTNHDIAIPKIPPRHGYSASWEYFSMSAGGDLAVNAIYTPIRYTIQFVDENGIPVSEEMSYTIESLGNVTVPDVPAKDHYTGEWEHYELTMQHHCIVRPVYTPIEYKVTFVANGNIIAVLGYTMENPAVLCPDVPHKHGYEKAWRAFDLSAGGDVIVYAEYSIITYRIDFLDENGVPMMDTQYYTVADRNIAVPFVPEREHYDSVWSNYDLLIGGDYEVKLSYIPIQYSIRYLAGGKEYVTQTYTVETYESYADPAFPEKVGYTGQWSAYHLFADRVIEVNADYTAIVYSIDFVDRNGMLLCERQTYTVEDTDIMVPSIPQKEHYESKWQNFDLSQGGNLVVRPVYEPIIYTVAFKADGKITQTKEYTIEMPVIDEPSVPSKRHYTGKWADYNLFDGGDLIVEAIYTPVSYSIVFLDEDGSAVCPVQKYTVENTDINVPSVPGKEHYEGKWESFDLQKGGNLSVKAIYTAIRYTISFVDENGNPVDASQYYDVENHDITLAKVPEKKHYTGAWEVFDLADGGNQVIRPVYIPIPYTVTFVVEGVTVGVVDYDIEHIQITDLSIPEKKHYVGRWEAYDLSDGGHITVQVIYEPIVYYVFFVNESGEQVGSPLRYDVENQGVEAPPVPHKEHYDGRWDTYADLSEGGDRVICPIYTPIPYTLTFVIDGKTVAAVNYTIENPNIQSVPVPPKEHYIGKWEIYDLTQGGNQTVQAVYTPIVYTLRFVDENGNPVDNGTIDYTVEQTTIPSVPVPIKNHYEGAWQEYALSEGGDRVIYPVYTPIEYTVTFVADDQIIDKVPYDIEHQKIQIAELPAKEHYSGMWETYDLSNGGDITVRAVYTVIIYHVVFVDEHGNQISDSVDYDVENKDITEIPVPPKEHYLGKWEEYELNGGNRTVRPIYTPITYSVMFMVDGAVIGETEYTIENTDIQMIEVPHKTHYEGEWETVDLSGGGNIRIRAVYTPIIYHVTFTDETGNRIAEPLTYTIENTEISLLEVPEKSHYTGVWEPFDLADGGDHVIRPVYTPIEYQVSFMVDGEIVHTAAYNIEKTDIQIIELPERKHYTASWEEYDLSSGGDKVIHAVYTAIIYHVIFVDESGEGVGSEMDYTVEDYGHVSMEIPQKEHYTGKWEEYDLSDGGDRIIRSIYTPIEYRIEFVVDGRVIQTVTYTVESPEIELPSIPEKAGFSAEWEAFDPTVYQDRVIHAVYTNLDTETETLPNIHTSGCNCSGVGGCNSFVGAMPLLGMVLCALLFAWKKRDQCDGG